MDILIRRSPGTIALTSALLVLAAPASAQECTAMLSPSEVDSGKVAVELNLTLSEPVGAIQALEAPPGSGVSVASPGDVPRTHMARANEAREAIAMGESETSWTVWLNTVDARPGVYRVVFAGGDSRCTGEVTVVN